MTGAQSVTACPRCAEARRWAQSDDVVEAARQEAAAVRERMGGATLLTVDVDRHVEALVGLVEEAVARACLPWVIEEEREAGEES